MRGVTILKAEDDKTRILNDHCLMAYSGEAGDTGPLICNPAHCPTKLSEGTAPARHANKKLWKGKSPVCRVYSSQCAALWDEVELYTSVVTFVSLKFCQN